MKPETMRTKSTWRHAFDGETYQVFEDPVGLMTVPNTTADTIFGALNDILTRLSLQLTDYRDQGCNGACNIQGRISKVAKQIQEEAPAALVYSLYAHYLKHCFNKY